MQADWNTNDYTAQSFIKNKPPLTYVPEISLSTITGNMECTSNITCSSNVSALQFVGSGAGLTNVPSIWKTNGTSVYIPSGSNVGIGTSSPSVALDVSGGVNVSGGLTTSNINTGNVATRTFIMTGTLPSTVNTISSAGAVPAGIISTNTSTNIANLTGAAWNSVTNYTVPRAFAQSASYTWDFYIINGILYVMTGPTATNIIGQAFKVVITTA